MHSCKCNLYCATLSVSDLERAEICEKYNDPNTKELIKKSCYRSNSHVGSTVSNAIAVHKVFESQLQVQAYLFINDVIRD